MLVIVRVCRRPPALRCFTYAKHRESKSKGRGQSDDKKSRQTTTYTATGGTPARLTQPAY